MNAIDPRLCLPMKSEFKWVQILSFQSESREIRRNIDRFAGLFRMS